MFPITWIFLLLYTFLANRECEIVDDCGRVGEELGRNDPWSWVLMINFLEYLRICHVLT